MAPILIDNRGLIKLGLISLLTVLVVFRVGYFSGYQKASVFYTTTSEIENLELPERNFVDANNIDPHSPETVIAGEEIDVDQPVMIDVVEAQNQSNKNNFALIVSAESSKAPAKKLVAINPSPKISIVDVQQTPSKSNKSPDSSRVDNSNDAKNVDVSRLTNDELNEIKYSVQVGVYGNLINAENMMKILQTRQFDAYVGDYKNKKNEIRYNVRFGYFTNKQSAIKGLNRYKQVEKSDGYLVNFSIENIVNLADKNTINDNVKPEPLIDVIDKSKPSEKGSSEITQNRVRQEKYLTKLQSEILIKN